MKLSSSATTKPFSVYRRIVYPNVTQPRSAMSVVASSGDFAGSSAPSSHPAKSILLRTLLVYWHLLSLDAPTVAMLWSWFIAKTSGVLIPHTSVLAMGVAVWVLYAADRLLDSRQTAHTEQLTGSTVTRDLHNAIDKEEPIILSAASRTAAPREAKSKDPDAVHAASATETFLQRIRSTHHPGSSLEPRHLFHRLHSRAFLTGIAVALLAVAVLVLRLPIQALRLYLVLGILLAVYFTLIHKKHLLAARLPKEIAVGIFFSAATFIPTIARSPALRGPLLPAAVLFGLICSLNCLFIYVWEHPAPFAEAHPATRFALALLPQFAALAILASSALALSTEQWQLPSAISGAALLLLLLHVKRRHLDPTTLRAAADLCLLTPLAFVLTLK